YIIKVSFVGLKTQEKAISLSAGETAEINFTLSENAERLAEVVITASRSNMQVPSIGKAGINPIDLPQSSSIVSSQVINDQQASKLSDVMKNVSGVAMGSSRGSTSENFFARCYSLGSYNYLENGSS
ncbi:MAG TPA: TonB-dependent receptor plug domain-containing protein, partial [Daejeonella sp.]|nr:TonB-dependent receptor plug domain-containing protein [Daejeonella sp.]